MKPKHQTNKKELYANDEIYLANIFGAIIRRRLLFCSVLITTVLLSAVYSYTRQPRWQGYFKIVLQSQNSEDGSITSLLSNNKALARMTGINVGDKSQLKTEVEILESPSVLKPVYEYFVASKQSTGEASANWSYEKWFRKTLKIDLKPGTSVLKISYVDTDQALIMPTITKISKEYQAYSGRARSKALQNGINYTTEQLNIYKQLSNISNRKLDQYKIKYGINYLSKPDINNTPINTPIVRLATLNEQILLNQGL